LSIEEQEVAQWFAERPPALLYIYGWFQDLCDWREQGFGVGPLPHREIKAWADLMQLDISPSEVAALRGIDREYRLYRYYKDNPEKSRERASLTEQFAQIQQQRKARETISGSG
jgi:hypothetical protein